MLEQIIQELESKISKSIDKTNITEIFNQLDNIKGNTLLCGVDGSHVVSIFLEKVLIKKRNIPARNIDVEEYYQNDFNQYSNLIVVSHRGKNHGVKSLMNTQKNKCLLTTRKSRISNEKTLYYVIEDRIKSFVSFDDTYIPLSIILCYYLDTKKMPENIMPEKENFDIKNFSNINIIYDYQSKTCATFLESSIIEAGIAPVTMHTKYSFCHGRSNIVSEQMGLTVYLCVKESELDYLLMKEIPKINSNFVILKTSEKDSVIADYILTFKALYLLEYISKNFSKNFVNVKYNQIVSTIYNFKGKLV